MRIVISHLTRMDAPRICVAGIEASTGRHVRPTVGRSRQLTRRMLAEQGGPFSVGALVELGEVTPDPDPPETEDHLFWPEQAKALGRLSPNRYLELLRANSSVKLQSIFGSELRRQAWSYAVDEGHGSTSLGVLRLRRKPDIQVDHYAKLRLRLSALSRPAYLPVTDVRLVEPDHKTIRMDLVEDVRQRMTRGVETFLMLGLSRAFQKEGDDRARHWLQVNGICLADRPVGDQP
jgi:hypothetical protein